MLKKIWAVTLAAVLAAGLFACGSTTETTTTATDTSAETEVETTEETTTEEETTEEETTEEETETEKVEVESDVIAGAWEFRDSETAYTMDDYQTAFDEAVKVIDDCEMRPVALLGTQVVAGQNLCFLVDADIMDGSTGEVSATEYKLVFMYQDTEGNTSVSAVADFDINAETFGEETETGLDGGWYTAEDTYAKPGKDLVDILDKAQEGMTGAEYQLITVVGTQGVAGTDYLMLCKIVPVAEDAESTLAMVTVCTDADGNASITEVQPFSIPYFSDNAHVYSY